MYEQAVILLRFSYPSIDGWLDVQFQITGSGGANVLRIDEKENGFGFVANSGSDNVVDEYGVVHFEVFLEGLSAE